MKRRFVSLWFPRLATDRLARERGRQVPRDHGSHPAGRPVAATVEIGNRVLLAAVDHAAEGAGLAPGMSLADARAIVADLRVLPADPRADAALLARLGRWCGRWTPLVAADGPDGLTLDCTGCAHLFGGEAAMLADMTGRLSRLGFAVAGALADTAGAARALARFGKPGAIAPPGGTARALERLPVAALGLDRDSAAGLATLGLRRIGDLYGLPRGSLAARFGRHTVQRLDRALGHAAEPFAALREEGMPREHIAFAEPVGTRGDIDAALEHLLELLNNRLERRGLGARRLELAFHRVDGTAQFIVIGTARPLRDPVALARLFRDRLDGVDPGFGIEAMLLSAPATDRLAETQAALEDARAAADGMAALVERLGNRFGFAALRRAVPVDSHLPERAWLAMPAVDGDPAADAGAWPSGLPRPARLFPRPEPVEAEAGFETAAIVPPPAAFRWRGRRHVLHRAQGPERIAPEWWRDDPVWRDGVRDYWRVEDEQGRRFWLYRGGRPPGWHLHGLFA